MGEGASRICSFSRPNPRTIPDTVTIFLPNGEPSGAARGAAACPSRAPLLWAIWSPHAMARASVPFTLLNGTVGASRVRNHKCELHHAMALVGTMKWHSTYEDD